MTSEQSDDPQALDATYPITLTNLRGALAVVVGGGAVGGRKLRGLLAVGAAVRLISPAAAPELHALVEARAGHHIAQAENVAGRLKCLQHARRVHQALHQVAVVVGSLNGDFFDHEFCWPKHRGFGSFAFTDRPTWRLPPYLLKNIALRGLRRRSAERKIDSAEIAPSRPARARLQSEFALRKAL